MSERSTIAIFAESKAVYAYLVEMVSRAGFEGTALEKIPTQAAMVLAVGRVEDIPRLEGQQMLLLGDGASAVGVRALQMPVRAAEVMENIGRIVNAHRALPARVEIGGHTLDTRESLWISKGESAIRLTEKEVAIMCCLKESAGSSISRQALLDAVWAYADGVETHTLETHIYRLRQKIEADPSMPDILLTAEDGYRLNI